VSLHHHAATQRIIESGSWPTVPGHFPAQGDLLSWCQHMGPAMAAVLVLAGVVYLLFGIYCFKALVTLNAGAVGGMLGSWLGGGAGNSTAGAIVGAFGAAALTWPLMKYAVAVMGGIYGLVLGAAIWRAVGLEASYCWAGGMIGLVFFGMLSFVLFRGSVMMYTSLQGSVMLVVGLLGMIYKYQDIAPHVTSNLSSMPFILPVCIFVPAVAGLIFQQSQYPDAAK
jgi:hypothetical protein